MGPECLFFIENDFHQARIDRDRVQNETILNVFPGANEQSRLVLVKTSTMCGLNHLVLRQETHSPDVGWFTQSCVVIEPNQVAGLKMTLSPQNHGGANEIARTKQIASSTTLRLHEAV